MMQLREILCPTDRSDTSVRALDYAVMLAGWYDASVTALEVVWPSVPPVSTSVPPVLTPDQLRGFQEEFEQFVRSRVHGAARVRGLLVQGQTVPQILHQARELSADLVVLGTHGHSGFERFILGSVTEKVLRRAPCPVLTIPPAAPDAPATPRSFESILCAVDFSPSSLEALQYALLLAQESGRRLTLLHVFDWDEDRLLPEQFDRETRDIRREHRQETLNRLHELVGDEARIWCSCRELTGTGRPHEEIVRTAAAVQADLVVIGAHGRRVADLLFFGSTTNQVVRHATCPVLTIRA